MLGDVGWATAHLTYMNAFYMRERELWIWQRCAVCAINIIIMENVEDTAERIIKKFFLWIFHYSNNGVLGIHVIYAKEINIRANHQWGIKYGNFMHAFTATDTFKVYKISYLITSIKFSLMCSLIHFVLCVYMISEKKHHHNAD